MESKILSVILQAGTLGAVTAFVLVMYSRLVIKLLDVIEKNTAAFTELKNAVQKIEARI